MASTDWRLEMHKMLAAFNRQATYSLGIMKTAFKQNGLSFTPEFKQHFIQASINRIIETYDQFEINSLLEEQLNVNRNRSATVSKRSSVDNEFLLNSIHLPNHVTDEMNKPSQMDVAIAEEHCGRSEVKLEANDSASCSFNGGMCDTSSVNTFGTVLLIIDSDDEEAVVVNIPKNEPTEARASECASSSSDKGTNQSSKGGIKNENDIKPKREEEMTDDIPMVEIEFNRKVRAPSNEKEVNRATINIRGTVASMVNKATKMNDKKSAPKQSNLKKHLKCTVCQYSSNLVGNLNRHMLKHTGEKPHRCGRCGRRFTRAEQLRKHTVTHTDDFPFHCEGCFRGFPQKDEKDFHEKECKARRYECHLCKKSVTCGKTKMERHMRQHTGEKPFRCEICMQHFTLKGSLKTHLNNIHTRINP